MTITTKYLKENGWEPIDDIIYEKGKYLCVYTEFDEDWYVYERKGTVWNVEDFEKLTK